MRHSVSMSKPAYVETTVILEYEMFNDIEITYYWNSVFLVVVAAVLPLDNNMKIRWE